MQSVQLPFPELEAPLDETAGIAFFGMPWADRAPPAPVALAAAAPQDAPVPLSPPAAPGPATPPAAVPPPTPAAAEPAPPIPSSVVPDVAPFVAAQASEPEPAPVGQPEVAALLLSLMRGERPADPPPLPDPSTPEGLAALMRLMGLPIPEPHGPPTPLPPWFSGPVSSPTEPPPIAQLPLGGDAVF